MLRQLAIVFVLALCANTLLAQTPDNEKPSSTNDAENKNNLESRFGGFSDLNGDSSMYLGYTPIGWNRPGYGGGWNRPGFGGGYNRPGFGGGYGRPGIGGGWGRPGYGGGWGGGRPGYGPY